MEQANKDAIADAMATAKLAQALKITPKQAAILVLWFKLAMAFGR